MDDFFDTKRVVSDFLNFFVPESTKLALKSKLRSERYVSLGILKG